jgi:hypothetical protein
MKSTEPRALANPREPKQRTVASFSPSNQNKFGIDQMLSNKKRKCREENQKE